MNKKTGIGIAILVVLIVAMLGIYGNYVPKKQEGQQTASEAQKAISIAVIDEAGKTTTYEWSTEAETLQQAMEEAKSQGFTYEGEEGEYGLMVHTVNGQKAVYAENGAYWSFYVNDEFCMYGISEQPVNDGDAFSIRYTKE